MYTWWGEVCETVNGRWLLGRPHRQLYFIQGGTIVIPEEPPIIIFSRIELLGSRISEVGYIDLYPKAVPITLKTDLRSAEGLEWRMGVRADLNVVSVTSLLSQIPISAPALLSRLEEHVSSILSKWIRRLQYEEVRAVEPALEGDAPQAVNESLGEQFPFRIDRLFLSEIVAVDANAEEALQEKHRHKVIREKIERDQIVAAETMKYRHEAEQQEARHQQEMETQRQTHALELSMERARGTAREALLAAAVSRQTNRKDEIARLDTELKRLSGLAGIADERTRSIALLGSDGFISLERVAADLEAAKAKANYSVFNDILKHGVQSAFLRGQADTLLIMLKERGIIPQDMNINLNTPQLDVPEPEADADAEKED